MWGVRGGVKRRVAQHREKQCAVSCGAEGTSQHLCGVQGGVDHQDCPTPGEAVRCFMQCAGAALAARDGAFSSRALALRRLAEAAHARGLLDADEALKACHLAR